MHSKDPIETWLDVEFDKAKLGLPDDLIHLNTTRQYKSRRPQAPDSRRKGPPKALIYTRVSGSAKIEVSISRQFELAAHYAEHIGATVEGHFSDEAISGVQTLGRDGLDRMLARIKQGDISLVIVEDLSRLSRNEAEGHSMNESLTEHNCELHDLKNGHISNLAFAFGSFHSVKEREVLRDRMIAGRQRAVMAGELLQPSIYGFRRTSTGRNQFVPVSERIDVVLSINADLIAGKTATEIALSLTGRKPTPGDCAKIDRGEVPPETRSAWQAQMVRKIARNPIYAGIVLTNQTALERDPKDYRKIKIHRRPWDEQGVLFIKKYAVVDHEQWIAAERASHSTNSAGIRSDSGLHKYLLHGRVRCAACDRNLRVTDGGHLRKTHLFDLRLYECREVECRSFAAMPVASLEGAVLELAAARQNALAQFHVSLGPLEKTGAGTSAPVASRRAALENELKSVEGALNAAMKVITSGRNVPSEQVDYWLHLQERRAELKRLIAAGHRHSDRPTEKGDTTFAKTLRALIREKPIDIRDLEADGIANRLLSMFSHVEVAMLGSDWSVTVHWEKEGKQSVSEGVSGLLNSSTLTVVSLEFRQAVTIALEDYKSTLGHQRQPVTPQRRAQLEEAFNATDCERSLRRLRAVQAVAAGEKDIEVAKRYEVARSDLLKWLHIFREHGPEALMEYPSTIEYERAATLMVKREFDKVAHGSNLGWRFKDRLGAVSEYVCGASIDEILVRFPKLTFRMVNAYLNGFANIGISSLINGSYQPARLAEKHLAYARQIIAIGLDPENPKRPVTKYVLARAIEERFGARFDPETIRKKLAKQGYSVRQATRPIATLAEREGERIAGILRRIFNRTRTTDGQTHR